MSITATSYHAGLVLLAVLGAQSGCSAPSRSTAQPASPDATATFSAEQRRIAQSLSIWEQQPTEGESALDRAVVCELALAALAERLQGTALLSEEQARAFDQARAVFNRRAQAGNASEADIRESVRKATEKYPEPTARTRFAVGCLRDLQTV